MVGVKCDIQVLVDETFMDGLANGLVLKLRIDLRKNGFQTLQLFFIFGEDEVGDAPSDCSFMEETSRSKFLLKAG